MTTLAPAATSAAPTPEVVGKALYLELVPIVKEGKPVSHRVWGGVDTVRQVIVFPRGNTPEGYSVEPTIYSRAVSPHYPRSQWDSNAVRPHPSKADLREALAKKEEENSLGNYVDYTMPTTSEIEAMPDEVRNQLLLNSVEKSLFDLFYDSVSYKDSEGNYATKPILAWELRQKFSVEVTDKDYSDIRSWKTPQAVIRRITKARVAAGHPEKLV